jgi:Leucine-rich repeat (LRR) protein
LSFSEILNFGSNNLGTDEDLVPVIGAIPASIANLVNLRSINLGLNLFGGSLPFGLFAQMSNLAFIDLLFNELTGSIPASVGQLTALEYLDLSQNALTGVIPTELGILVALTDLRLAKTDLRELPDGLCAPNCLNGRIPTEIGNLANLRKYP